MFWIAAQMVDFFSSGRWTLLLVLGAITLFEYSLYAYYYSRYKPYSNNFRVPVSVVVSVFKEEPRLFTNCLRAIREQLKPSDELLIILDGPNYLLRTIAERFGKVYVKGHGGKRSTLAYGCDRAKNGIILTVDSDTVLCPDCLDKIIMPFINPEIGAVSAQSRILEPERNWTVRLADAHEILAHDFIQKATSANGNLAVLYGRCLAIRREVWGRISDAYRNKTFLGKAVESGDDNDITIFTIDAGYKTFMQYSALAHSDCPSKFWDRLHQQYRYNRSFCRATLDWINHPRIITKAKLAFSSQMCALILPFLVIAQWEEWLYHVVVGYPSLLELSTPATVFLTILSLFTVLTLRKIILLKSLKDIPIWVVFSLYSWIVLNMLYAYAVLTIWREKPQLIQYSRNK